jgi:RNA polymerase sigma factor (TIGR02999 family)
MHHSPTDAEVGTHRDADRIRSAAGSGVGVSLNDLLPELYEDLRRLAERHLRDERRDHTLQASALVHEAYLRLAQIQDLEVRGRAELMALAARTMRRILVDHARSRRSAKRGGGRLRVTLTDAGADTGPPALDLIALDAALERLTAIDARQSTIVQLRFLAGMTVKETADALDVSSTTVKREVAFARAWLFRELSDRDDAGPG